MHMTHKTFPTYKNDYTDDFDTQNRPLPEIVAYDTNFVDPQCGGDPYWDEDLYHLDKIEHKDNPNKTNDQIERNDLITDSQVSETLRCAIIVMWTLNPQLPDTSPFRNFPSTPQKQQRQVAVIDNQNLPELQVTPDGLTKFLPLSTINTLTIEKETQNSLISNGGCGVEHRQPHGRRSSVRRYFGSLFAQNLITGFTHNIE